MARSMRATATIAAERREVENSAVRPRASLRSGDHYFGSIGVRGQISEGLIFTARAAIEQADAKADFEAYQRAQVSGDVGLALVDLRTPAGPLQAQFGVSYSHTEYAAADPLITSRIARSDQRAALTIGLDVPVTRHSGLSLRVEHSDNRSNLPNYRYADTYAALVMRVALAGC
jgi:hypothetical protein